MSNYRFGQSIVMSFPFCVLVFWVAFWIPVMTPSCVSGAFSESKVQAEKPFRTIMWEWLCTQCASLQNIFSTTINCDSCGIYQLSSRKVGHFLFDGWRGGCHIHCLLSAWFSGVFAVSSSYATLGRCFEGAVQNEIISTKKKGWKCAKTGNCRFFGEAWSYVMSRSDVTL